MSSRLEAQMIGPVQALMQEDMGLDVVETEFSAGYGIADLVGASLCPEKCHMRRAMGVATPLDHKHFAEVLSVLRPGVRRTVKYLLARISFSESTLRRKVLPKMETHGMINKDSSGNICLRFELPQPAKNIVAIEVKQTRWREAILQARRYGFFADQTYIAVWSRTVDLVDRDFLRQHHIGLIGVEPAHATVFIEAPRRKARDAKMQRYCAEFLYKKAFFS